MNNRGYAIGEYKLTCFVEDIQGNITQVADMNYTLDFQAGELTSKQSENGHVVELILNDVKTQGIAKWLTFIVWSDRGG